jgi:2-keto-4-pentenoate hydratase/2-oxohepta-3-ene-1,7-dioic acid hydratase in catechol pathway
VQILRVLDGHSPVFARLISAPTSGAPGSCEILGADPPWREASPETTPGVAGVVREFSMVDLLAPVVPGKVLCVGRNYAAHAKELGNEVPKEPLLFLKPSSAVVGWGAMIELPPESSRVEHEAELAVVIGKRAKRVTKADALTHVFGYTCAGDITARDLQRADVQFSRAKGFDGFCPLGPWIDTTLAPDNLEISCAVNGVRRQHGNTSQMVFDVATLISYMSHAMTLEPGDVLLTGTPEGVGPLVAGDTLSIRIARPSTEGLALDVSFRAVP